MIITDHEILRYPEVKGIFCGGCVDRGEGSAFRRSAHAHTSKADPNRGWICLRGPKNLRSLNLMFHEAAHIITGQGHTLTWMRKYVEIGGRIDSDTFVRFKGKYLASQNKLEAVL
jgi:hypothetical protein